MDHDDELPASWEASLDRSRAQVERGESVPLEPFMARLRTTIGRMKAGLASEKADEAKPQA